MSKLARSGGKSRFDGLALAIALFLSFEGISNSVSAQQAVAPLAVHRSQATGLATFVTARDGGAIPVAGGAAAQAQPMDFLRVYGRLFGVTDPDRQLVVARVAVDRLGQTHTTYHQVHKGVPVFSGVLKVHQTADGSFRAANGNFYPIRDTLNAAPTLTMDQATARALDAVSAGQPAVEHSELVIVDPGWYGDPPIGAHLAYYIILADPSVPLREAFFVNAHKGNVLDHWNLLDASLDRVVIDDSQAGDPIVRAEGDLPANDFEVDSAYDYSGDTYDFLFRAFGRDSYDDAGGTLTAVVHLVSSRCPNAFGGGGASFFCDGTATDDIVAHEWGHSIMDFTANLIYQNQSGQLNESYSDVWGELIDLFNGNAGFAGPPGGTPWPVDANYIGPGTDTPNTLRTGCVSGAFMTVNSPGSIAGDYLAKPAAFGPALTVVGTPGDIVVADPVRACDVDLPFSNAAAMNGKIVLVDRGDCFFTEKVKNAQDGGAIAVIVANNLSAGLPPMGGSDGTVMIPSVGIGQADGGLVKTEVQSGTVNVTLRINANPDVRWLIGEDSSGFGGAIRDMWQPSCAGHPDTANHPFQTCNPNDNGGVHSGSGVPNHAFAMLCDGKTFNGFTVNAIGPIKAAAVWYRALNVYLTVASNFQDAYAALNQAAADLVGNSVFDPRDGSVFATFTAADAAEVDKALRAVEMNTEGLCGSQKNILDSTPPVKCANRSVLFFDDFESGVGNWTVSNTGPFGPPTPYDWEQISGGLPVGWPGTVWFVADANIGNCDTQDESAVHSLFTPTMALPADLPAPTLAFSHFMESETFFDGGNIKIRVNAGSWQIIPKSAFQFNGYNSALRTSGNTNPMAGQEAWTGFALETRQWGTSLVDLSSFVSGGDDVQLRFDFGKDGCFGITGWFVDDFELYTCSGESRPDPLEDADDGLGGDYNRVGDFKMPNSVVAGGQEIAIRGKLDRLYIDSNEDLANGCPVRQGLPDLSGFDGKVRYLGAPEAFRNNSLEDNKWVAAKLQCTPFYRDWSPSALAANLGISEVEAGTIYYYGAEVVPCSIHSVQQGDQACLDSASEECLSAPLEVRTALSGDIWPPFNNISFTDIGKEVEAFKSIPVSLDGPTKWRSMLRDNEGAPGADINFTDIGKTVDGFKTIAYPEAGPTACP